MKLNGLTKPHHIVVKDTYLKPINGYNEQEKETEQKKSCLTTEQVEQAIQKLKKRWK